MAIDIAGESDMQLIAQVSSCNEVQSILKTERSDVTLVDEAVVTDGQYKALQRYSKQPLSSSFVLVTAHPLDYSVEQTWHAFADAHLLKGVCAAELPTACRKMLRDPAFDRPGHRNGLAAEESFIGEFLGSSYCLGFGLLPGPGLYLPNGLHLPDSSTLGKQLGAMERGPSMCECEHWVARRGCIRLKTDSGGGGGEASWAR